MARRNLRLTGIHLVQDIGNLASAKHRIDSFQSMGLEPRQALLDRFRKGQVLLHAVGVVDLDADQNVGDPFTMQHIQKFTVNPVRRREKSFLEKRRADQESARKTTWLSPP